jgi:hypothetical protein
MECEHVMDEDSMEYDSRYGRKGVCKFCGTKLSFSRMVDNSKKKPKVHMSKKERKKAKAVHNNG